MASMKMARWGDAQWKSRYATWECNGQNALLKGSKRYLRLTKTLTRRQTTYQSPAARRAGATKEVRASDAEHTWAQLVRKWSVVPGYQEVVFAEDKPLGYWRKIMIEMFDAQMPLPPQ
jgi:hypothetical protein